MLQIPAEQGDVIVKNMQLGVGRGIKQMVEKIIELEKQVKSTSGAASAKGSVQQIGKSPTQTAGSEKTFEKISAAFERELQDRHELYCERMKQLCEEIASEQESTLMLKEKNSTLQRLNSQLGDSQKQLASQVSELTRQQKEAASGTTRTQARVRALEEVRTRFDRVKETATRHILPGLKQLSTKALKPGSERDKDASQQYAQAFEKHDKYLLELQKMFDIEQGTGEDMLGGVVASDIRGTTPVDPSRPELQALPEKSLIKTLGDKLAQETRAKLKLEGQLRKMGEIVRVGESNSATLSEILTKNRSGEMTSSCGVLQDSFVGGNSILGSEPRVDYPVIHSKNRRARAAECDFAGRITEQVACRRGQLTLASRKTQVRCSERTAPYENT